MVNHTWDFKAASSSSNSGFCPFGYKNETERNHGNVELEYVAFIHVLGKSEDTTITKGKSSQHTC